MGPSSSSYPHPLQKKMKSRENDGNGNENKSRKTHKNAAVMADEGVDNVSLKAFNKKNYILILFCSFASFFVYFGHKIELKIIISSSYIKAEKLTPANHSVSMYIIKYVIRISTLMIMSNFTTTYINNSYVYVALNLLMVS